MEKLGALTTPPVVGETYLVPCARWYDDWLPVLGYAHSDPILGTDAAKQHYHIDVRFATEKELLSIGLNSINDLYPGRNPFFNSVPIPAFYVGPDNSTTRKMMARECLREMPAYTYHVNEIRYLSASRERHGQFEDMLENKKLLGKCKVCPHRAIPLGSIKPINGIITCPGHNLDWDAETGCLVRRTKKNKDGYDYDYTR